MEYFRSTNINCNNGKSHKSCANTTTAAASLLAGKTETPHCQPSTSSSQNILISPIYSSSVSSTSSPASVSSTASKKRKRRSTLSSTDSSSEHDQPVAKRAHRSSGCKSEPGSSAVSSVPSPVEDLIHEIDSRSSSECLSSVTEYDIGTPRSDVIIPATSPSSSSQCTTDAEEYSAHGQRTPHEKKAFEDYVSQFVMTPAEVEPRLCPLPALSWANANDVWGLMCKKDELASFHRDAAMLENHPGLQPRMRAILLDWLIEVCEVYKLHRETYFLAVDYLDRFLSTQKKVQKTHLQLIGITCLFIAAKVEEIYPPKIGEFAYVTDGACQEDDILQNELLLLQALDWSISPVTAIGWLGVYMQLNASNRTPNSLSAKTNKLPSKYGNSQQQQRVHSQNSSNNLLKNSRKLKANNSNINTNAKSNLTCSDSGISLDENDDAFIYPQFSGMEFVQTAQLLDLCSLDVGMGNYPYSVIAAAAISHTFNRETALRVSGLDWSSIHKCAQWMEPFFNVISEESGHLYLLEQNDQIPSKHGLGHICPNIVTDESHIIQTHTTSMAMYDKVTLLLEQRQSSMMTKIKQEASPGVGLLCPEGLLTPPASSRKPLEDDENIENVPDKTT